MEAKFTSIVKDTIANSRIEAIKNGHDFIGAEHLLLGMLHDSTQKNSAVESLTTLKVDTKNLYTDLTEVTQTYKKAEGQIAGSIPLTKQAEKMLKISYLEAKILKSDFITSFHLLLSILRDEDSSVTQLLKEEYHVTYDILKKLSETPDFEKIYAVEDDNNFSIYDNTSALSLIFDSAEYTADDIKEILSVLSELYHSIGGDYLKVKGMSQFECLTELDLA